MLEVGHIFRAAISTGVLKTLADGQKTVDEIATSAKLNRKAAELLVNALLPTGILEKYDTHIALSPAAQMLPDDFLEDQHWQHLDHFLRSGESIARRDDLLETDQAYEAQLIQNEWMRTPAAMDSATALDYGKSRRGMRVLELGCGSGIFSATFAHRDPDSTFLLADTAENLTRAKKTVESIGVEKQFEFIEIEDLNPPTDNGGFDLVIIAGQISHKSANWLPDWLVNVRRVMHFDGELVLIDLFPGQESGVKNLAFLELQLALRTSHGQLHHPTDLQETLKKADFGKIQFAHLPSPPHYWGLMVAAFQ
jgi:ubiquinone/menaquinone biosynthesis C-methylase UbiE